MWKTEKQARRAGNQAISKMLTKAWKVRVLENLGWHVCIERANVSVSIYKEGKRTYYHAMIDSDAHKCGGALAMWTADKVPNYTDPNRAVKFALKRVKDVMDRLNNAHRAAMATMNTSCPCNRNKKLKR